MGCLLTLFLMLIGYGISFGVTAGAFWLICWALNFAFSWKIVVGVWVVICILQSIFSHPHSS